MKRLVLVLLALALLLPASASATTIIAPPSPWPFQTWADEALVPTPPGSLELVLDDTFCGGEGIACTGPTDPIYFDPTFYAGKPGAVRQVFDHELGHHFDYDVMEDWARARFEWLVGETRPWTEDPNAPNEKFAEAWALCAVRARLRHAPLEYGYGYHPSPRLHRKVCHLIAVVGA